LAVALKTMFDPAAANGAPASYQLRLDEHSFALGIDADRLQLVRGEAAAPAAVIDTDPRTLAALLWHGYPLDQALADGSVRIEGSKRAVARFLRLFPASAPVREPTV
jgi:hypothetical protein